MHRVVAHEQAEGRVVRVGLAAADHIARVDVLEVQLHADLFEMGADPAPQEHADVAELDVARGVAFVRCRQQFLARALGHHDHRVVAFGQAAFQRGEQPLQGKAGLGDQAEVHLVVHQHGGGGDEAGFAAHELDQADAVARAQGLGVGRAGGQPRLGDRGLEAEGGLHERDVGVDGLGDADHRELEAAPFGLGVDGECAALGAVTTDTEEHAHAEPRQGVDHAPHLLVAA